MSRQTDLDRPRRSERTSGSSLADTETESVLTEEHAAGTNLDKIRDILFGAQVRDHERRSPNSKLSCWQKQPNCATTSRNDSPRWSNTFEKKWTR